MKIRNGFVSNSSSSSFIVKYKDEDDKVSLTKNVMGDCLSNRDLSGYIDNGDKVTEEQRPGILQNMAEVFVKNLTLLNLDANSTEEDYYKIMKEIHYYSKDELPKFKMLKTELLKGYKLYEIGISDHFKEYEIYDGALEFNLREDCTIEVDYILMH